VKAVLEVAILHDWVLFALTLEFLFALHKNFIRSFASWDGIAISSENGALLGLPSTSTGGLAESAGAAKRIGVELAVRAFKILRKLNLGLAERDASVEIIASRGSGRMETSIAGLGVDRLGLAGKRSMYMVVRAM